MYVCVLASISYEKFTIVTNVKRRRFCGGTQYFFFFLFWYSFFQNWFLFFLQILFIYSSLDNRWWQPVWLLVLLWYRLITNHATFAWQVCNTFSESGGENKCLSVCVCLCVCVWIRCSYFEVLLYEMYTIFFFFFVRIEWWQKAWMSQQYDMLIQIVHLYLKAGAFQRARTHTHTHDLQQFSWLYCQYVVRKADGEE